MADQQLRRWQTITVVMAMAARAFLLAEPVFGSDDGWTGDHAICGVAQKQGRRPYQEDRVICMPHVLFPGPGGCLLHLGMFGVFDGHNGALASEYASVHLPYLLRHHTLSILMLDSTNDNVDVCLEAENFGANAWDLEFFDINERLQQYIKGANKMENSGSCKEEQLSTCSYRAVLKEAMSRSLADIDSALISNSKEDIRQSGTTAVVALKVENNLLVANIGDSQAFICSFFTSTDLPKSNLSFSTEADGKVVHSILTQELTIAHHPDRRDEKLRIEAAGGFVSTWGGIARVNGQLAVSRALGDAMFKKFGVIAEPEFFGWQDFSEENSLLILTSDGICETKRPKDVCKLLQDEINLMDSSVVDKDITGTRRHYADLATTIVEAAYNDGSYDNLAAIVLPLNSVSLLGGTAVPTEIARNSQNIDKNIPDEFSGKKGALSCYQLINKPWSALILPLESSTGLVSRVDTDTIRNSNAFIDGAVEISHINEKSRGSAATWDVYHEQLICFRQPILSNEDEVCLNPETFSKYLRLIEAVPVLERNASDINVSDKVKRMEPDNIYQYTSIHKRYILTEHVGRGGFGEVWFAVRRNCFDATATDLVSPLQKVHDLPLGSKELKHDTSMHKMEILANSMKDDLSQEYFVLKRVLAEKGNSVYLSGLRERYFGELFLNAVALKKAKRMNLHKTKPAQETEDGLNHIARYIESVEGNNKGDFWLVFVNEGYPLSSMLYTTDKTIEKDKGHVRVLQPSKWWKWLKSTKDGQKEMRNLLHQLLLGVKACHDRNITHRDIKPENLMVRPTRMCLAQSEPDQLTEEFPCNLSLRIIDFGSAMDAYTLQNLYGSSGPTRYEQTEEYSPPEAFLERNWWRKHGIETIRYDLWSIGVVMLELALGTPHVFQIAARTRLLLDKHLEGWGTSALNMAYMLRAMMEMCILYPGKSGHHRSGAMDNSNPASWTCTEENLMLQIMKRDPLGIGFEDVWALRLLRGLLQWHPEDRMTVDKALRHPYFHSPLQGARNENT